MRVNLRRRWYPSTKVRKVHCMRGSAVSREPKVVVGGVNRLNEEAVVHATAAGRSCPGRRRIAKELRRRD